MLKIYWPACYVLVQNRYTNCDFGSFLFYSFFLFVLFFFFSIFLHEGNKSFLLSSLPPMGARSYRVCVKKTIALVHFENVIYTISHSLQLVVFIVWLMCCLVGIDNINSQVFCEWSANCDRSYIELHRGEHGAVFCPFCPRPATLWVE